MTKSYKSYILILLAAVMIAPASYSNDFSDPSHSHICKFGESNNTDPNFKINHCDKCVAANDDESVNIIVIKTLDACFLSKSYKTPDSIQFISNSNALACQRSPPIS